MLIGGLKKSVLIWSLLGACLVIGIAIGVTVYCWEGSADILRPIEGVPKSYSPVSYARGAVVSNGQPCANIGKKILEKYGSAVDAVIATMICDGVTCPHNMGIGGGFLMTVYIEKERKAYSLIARETAPAAATKNMFKGDSTLAQIGGLSVGVPGELRGYEAAHKKFGNSSSWSDLFQDTIELCRNGVPVSKALHNAIAENKHHISKNPTFSKVFLKEDGEVPAVGDKIRMLKLAHTLEVIAKEGADAFYNGSLTAGLVQDIRSAGGIITAQDLAQYSVRWEEPVTGELSGGRLMAYSAQAPGSGAVLLHILSILTGSGRNPPLFPSGNSFMDVHRITEAFKYAYGKRTLLADPHFVNISQVMSEMKDEQHLNYLRDMIVSLNGTYEAAEHYGANFTLPEDHGTANAAVIAPNGDAVAATSTINLLFGSRYMSPSTGIVLNNEMDDFSSPDVINYFGVKPSMANSIEPGKRPLSSMCPTVIVDQATGRVRLAIGSAGGTKITTSTALVSLWHLFYNISLKDAMDTARFHHQVYPMVWIYESEMSKDLVNWMEDLGHKVNPISSNAGSSGCVTGIAAVPTETGAGSAPGRWAYLEPYADPRRPGAWDGF